MRRVPTVFWGVLGIAIACALGTVVGHWYTNQRVIADRHIRSETLSGSFAQQRTFGVGDTLPNQLLEYLNGDTTSLYVHVASATLITFVLVDCKACHAAIERLAQFLSNPSAAKHFLVI